MSFYPSDYEKYLFHQGNLFQSYKMLGAKPCTFNNQRGVRFCCWAPNAQEVRVVGDFNNWQGHGYSMEKVKNSGLWWIFVPRADVGSLYKYQIRTQEGKFIYKSDPYGYYSEVRPQTASVVYSLENYQWQVTKWRRERDCTNQKPKPINIYEVHLGSWKRREDGDFYNYREIARELVPYCLEMGYTHIEIMPLGEHPFDGSWGYQVIGYYSLTSRYGTPEDFMYLVDCCHQAGLGVILDWVPGHFCPDAHGLANFDGTGLYEQDKNIEWGTWNFNFARPEVRSFLISNAYFLFEVFKIDGLRVDAVASMLYLDYGKGAGQWIPNKFGGNENLEAVEFLIKLNQVIKEDFPYALVIAEESSEWPLVTGETGQGGLGFSYKWNMGWMNDTLKYLGIDPYFRKWNHKLITFSFMYSFSEKFLLPLSHDEVVHCKKSLLEKMPGTFGQKFANLRLLYAYMMAHPGKKLSFMGNELAQPREWNHDRGLEWELLDKEEHSRFHRYIKDLNHLYLKEKALWQGDHSWQGLEWIEPDNEEQSIIIFLRLGQDTQKGIIVILNFTSQGYDQYRVGVPSKVRYQEIFNSDGEIYGGTNVINPLSLEAADIPFHNQPYSLELTLPPFGAIYLKAKK